MQYMAKTSFDFISWTRSRFCCDGFSHPL
jgi:hypothetical protein